MTNSDPDTAPTVPSSTSFTPPSFPSSAADPVRPAGRIVVIANQKGGVGKTTTAVNLSAALVELGQRVLVVDLDPQGNASTGLGLGSSERAPGVYGVISGTIEARAAVRTTALPGLSLLPSTIDLAGAEVELVTAVGRETRLAAALEPLRGDFDIILVDSPPSLGLLTVNGMAAADELLVPIQCEYYALEGLGQLVRNVGLVQQKLNSRLRLGGIVMTMYDPRPKLAEQVVSEVRGHFGAQVYDTVIPRSIRLAEAPGYGLPITIYDPTSRAAAAYRSLAREVLGLGSSNGHAGRRAGRRKRRSSSDEPPGDRATVGATRAADSGPGDKTVQATRPAAKEGRRRWPFRRGRGGEA
jgi:chromosome partitioning protein